MAEDGVTLHEYVWAWSGVPWRWGIADCCTFAAGRVMELTGIDPMARHRGSYHTENGAGRMLLRSGGLVAMFRSAREEYGPLPEACIVRYANGAEIAGLTDGRWAWHFSPEGVAALRRGALDVTVTEFG